ncbi:MAG: NADH-dependent [FeFe] hydrogenase, group A6 [Defluviitaleaceae bacterium]|nr:NADH-dependent [FeFe] hydrogenase, group A6 [Defluviitaleaceae bacterium]MCL2240369.1 NADH-dependent [FeFe] hydrogenase, group A6 [Defluviitaleaceae bacterium]
MVNIKINNLAVQVEAGTTILEAARNVGITIPTLCYMKMESAGCDNAPGSCRVCMVEQEGRANLIPACVTVVWEGMAIHTNTPRAIKTRRTVVELFLSNHPKDCLVCERNKNCELQTLAAELNIRENKYDGKMAKHEKDSSSMSLIRDPEKCVLCRRCETMCNDVQTVGVYSAINRSLETTVSTAFNAPVADSTCTFCGQCVSVCPTGALTQANHTADVWAALADPDKTVIVQAAPAIRVALGEEFGMASGARVTGKMVAGLRRLGFNHVYDTNFAADLTVIEEANELLERINNGGRLPMLTSCCPAWVKFIEHQFPTLLDVPSTCKSPHEMLGAIAKTYLAQKLGVDPKKMVVVSIMPCLAKKYESSREELGQGVDYVLTTRELASMFREAGLNFHALPDESFDPIMGESSGAADIFGTTGGVIEATARTVVHTLTGKNPANVEFTQLRGTDNIREATVKAGDTELKIGIANGLGSARKMLENIRDGKSTYHAIEIMACPGGCVAGGGQPYHGNDQSVIKERAASLYAIDGEKNLRVAHENTEVKALYAEFLDKPGSHKAHDLLHTSYVKRAKV